MELKHCPFCKEQIHENATACKHCGKYVGAALVAQQIVGVAFLAVAALVVAFVVIAYW